MNGWLVLLLLVILWVGFFKWVIPLGAIAYGFWWLFMIISFIIFGLYLKDK